MNEPTSAAQREAAKARYRRHQDRKRNRQAPSQERKRERLEWIIRYHDLQVDEPSRKRGEKRIGWVRINKWASVCKVFFS